MKRILNTLLWAAALAGGWTSGLAQGTAFTYQGQLSSGGSPANGSYDLTFSLFNTSGGGTPLSGPITNSAIAVSNGLFTVTLDFGSVFNSNQLWLGIGVRSHGSTGAFTQLSPLQELTPAPYAEYATTAGAANTVPEAAISAPQLNTVGGGPTNGEILSYNGVNLAWTNIGSSSSGWSLTGNSGTVPGTDFLGTTDNEPLQLRANGVIAMNLQGNPNNNNSVNISGGYWAAVGDGTFGVTDFGGGSGGPNSVYANYDTIGGGFNNTINPGAIYGTIPGGSGNVVSGSYSFAAGQQAEALHAGAFVWSDGSGGAFASTANDQFNVHASGGVRFVTGGAGMTIDGVAVSTGGGGGGSNSGWSLTGNSGTVPGTDFLGTTDNEPLQLRANGVIAMNLQGNPNNNNSVNISGGYWASVGSGLFGVTDFGGGYGGANAVYANYDTIGGGFNNTINTGATYGTIPGGSGNVVSGSYGFAAGQQAEALHPGAFVWSDGSGGAFASTANDQFNVHASGGVRFVTGGAGMTIDGVPVSTGGGGGGGSSGWSLTGNAGTVPGVDFLGTTDDTALQLDVNGERGWQLQPTFDSPNVIGGAPGNYVADGIVGATIGGGGTITLYGEAYTNSVFAYNGTIGGGLGNTIQVSSYESTIGGGNQNTIQSGAYRSSIGGGYLNVAQSNAYESVIGGGADNIVGGANATVPGGFNNSATGAGSFAAGVNAHTAYDDSFIWGDGTQEADGTGPDRFEVLATGGINFFTSGGVTSIVNGNMGINTSSPSQALEVNGEFMEVDGLGGLGCYVGDDGYGNDVQIGSLVSGITQVSCYNEADSAYMELNVGSLAIHGGSDLAEPFKISPAGTDVSQGSVLVIDDQTPGQLKLSDQPYDTRVAGVVSGANGIHPGIQMQQQGVLEGGRNVALTGRVYVHADASYGAIRPGDLLTTSATPGCAMKVSDHAKAEGAILGKAMSALSSGQGMVLVLVTLQ